MECSLVVPPRPRQRAGAGRVLRASTADSREGRHASGPRRFQGPELAHLLAQIDRTAPEGERDYLLFALLYDAGCASRTSSGRADRASFRSPLTKPEVMRRTHLRGHTSILKRLLIHAAGINLGLVMRTLVGMGTRGLRGVLLAFFDLFTGFTAPVSLAVRDLPTEVPLTTAQTVHGPPFRRAAVGTTRTPGLSEPRRSPGPPRSRPPRESSGRLRAPRESVRGYPRALPAKTGNRGPLTTCTALPTWHVHTT